MKQIINLRHLYTPIQPTIAEEGGDVYYTELLPAIELQDYIYCYWQLKTKQKLSSPFQYNVVADGCVDIFFDLDNLEDSSIMGFCGQNSQFSLDSNFNYIGIRFFPTIFPAIFDIDASELANCSTPLNLVLPFLSNYILQNVTSQNTLYQTALILNQYFREYISSHDFQSDSRLNNGIITILKSYDTIRIEDTLNKVVSSRQSRRLFKFYIGGSAKAFSQIIRFQNLLSINPSSEFCRKEKPFFDLGYYDQTHFIKEFKRFYGTTPIKVFN